MEPIIENDIAKDLQKIKDTTHITYGISIIILAIVLVGVVFIVAQLYLSAPSSQYGVYPTSMHEKGMMTAASTTPSSASSTPRTHS
jgi:hypothetical protein